MADNIVIVESPAKAKTIKKYLGRDFDVLASYGHVRDLVPKEGAVNPDKGYAMKYQVLEKNERPRAASSAASTCIAWCSTRSRATPSARRSGSRAACRWSW